MSNSHPCFSPGTESICAGRGIERVESNSGSVVGGQLSTNWTDPSSLPGGSSAAPSNSSSGSASRLIAWMITDSLSGLMITSKPSVKPVPAPTRADHPCGGTPRSGPCAAPVLGFELRGCDGVQAVARATMRIARAAPLTPRNPNPMVTAQSLPSQVPHGPRLHPCRKDMRANTHCGFGGRSQPWWYRPWRC